MQGGMTLNYWVVGKRGLIGVTAALSICIVASFLAANQLGKAVFANADKRVLPIYSVETNEKTFIFNATSGALIEEW